MSDAPRIYHPKRPFDRWDFILQERLHYVVMRTSHRNSGWLPMLPKIRIQYLQRKFKGNWMVVRCGEDGAWDFHVIGVSKKGKIAFCDHPDWRQHLSLEELGGKVPSCVRIARMMINPADRAYFGDFPEPINLYCHEQMNKKAARRSRRDESCWPWGWYGDVYRRKPRAP